MYNCTLESGEDFKHSDPNKSAGLIKGRGTAKNITVPKGKVINGLGDYNQKELELQENITNRLWFEK